MPLSFSASLYIWFISLHVHAYIELDICILRVYSPAVCSPETLYCIGQLVLWYFYKLKNQ